VPDAPTDLQFDDVLYAEITISWTTPGDDGGSAITSYQIWYKTSESFLLYGSTTETTLTLTNLPYDT
jgi:hypothetical protein